MNHAPPPPPQAESDRAARRIERVISNLLRLGVLTSLSIVLLGTILTFLRHPLYLSSPAEFERLVQGGVVYPHTPRQILAGLLALEGSAVVALGLLVLIATPVLRVAVSIPAFAAQKDRTYVVITSVVLVVLLTSFLLGAL